MAANYATAYAVVWTLTTLATHMTARRFTLIGDEPEHTVLTSIFAGALWPIMIIGLLEAGMLSLVASLRATRRPAPTFSEELADVVTL